MAAVPKAPPRTHAELMQAMRSPNGFDPIPPSQHEHFLDIEEPAANRAIAWVWSKTIRPGRGHERSPYARDERGILRHTHAAIDLGWTVSNTRTLFERLAAQGRIRADADGKIWLCGDVPAPRRTKGEDGEKELCTYFLTPHFAQYLQALEENERSQRRSEFEQLQTYKRKLAAEALAAARALGDELEQRWQSQIGYTPKKQPRGRPKTARSSPMLQLSLIEAPNFVHNSRAAGADTSGQNSNVTSEQAQTNGAQNSHPYVSEVQSLRELAPKHASSKNSATEAELEEEITRRIQHSAHLHEVGGQALDARTVRIIRSHLQRLLPNIQEIKRVLDILEDKSSQLARRPADAKSKTWGWIVGAIKSEVEQRTDHQPQDELLATIKNAARRKAMR